MSEPGGYVEATIRCECGSELLVHWRARTRFGHWDYSVRCPSCGASHGTPDTPLRLFRRAADAWVHVESMKSPDWGAL